MRYIHADIEQVSRLEFRTYVREYELFSRGTTKALAEYATYQKIEESEGLKSFTIVWREC